MPDRQPNGIGTQRTEQAEQALSQVQLEDGEGGSRTERRGAVETECQRAILCPASVRVSVRHPSHVPDRGYSQFSAFARTAGRSCFGMGRPGGSPRVPSGAGQGTSRHTSIHPLPTRGRRIGMRAEAGPETSGSSRSPPDTGEDVALCGVDHEGAFGGRQLVCRGIDHVQSVEGLRPAGQGARGSSPGTAPGALLADRG
jgi:hypothetical protein